MLDLELQTFEVNRQSLLSSASGLFALVYGAVVVGSYRNELDAVEEGYRRFGNVPFLVRRIAPVDEPMVIGLLS